jgi:uncharacterized damage-inducible protein DinB
MSEQEQLSAGVRRMKQFFDTSTSVLDESDAGFSPVPGTFTTAQVIAHVAQTIDWFIDGAFDGKGYNMDFAGMEKELKKVESLAAARAWLDRAIDRAANTALKATDEQLSTEVPGDPILTGMPRRAVFWALEDHTAHHRGALTVYSRLRGKTSPMPYG